MNKIIFTSCILAFLAFTFQHQPSTANQITGTIQFKDCPAPKNPRSYGNRDKTEIMHSKDSMAHEERNMIVSLHPLDFTPVLKPIKNARITQKEQTFLPNVLPVTKGTRVYFMNDDEFFHNVQSYTSKNRFCIGRRAPGISYCQKIKRTGVISLMCDIHSHMNAIILSLDTPYFTRVEKDGTFQLNNLPDGKYRLEIFQPNCPTTTDEVTLVGGEVVTVNY